MPRQPASDRLRRCTAARRGTRRASSGTGPNAEERAACICLQAGGASPGLRRPPVRRDGDLLRGAFARAVARKRRRADCSGLDASAACGRALGPRKVDPAYQDRRRQRRPAGRVDDGLVGALAAPGRRRRGCYDRAWHAGGAVLDCGTPRSHDWAHSRRRRGDVPRALRCGRCSRRMRSAICDAIRNTARTRTNERACGDIAANTGGPYSWCWRRPSDQPAGIRFRNGQFCVTHTPRRAMHMHRTGHNCAPPRNKWRSGRTYPMARAVDRPCRQRQCSATQAPPAGRGKGQALASSEYGRVYPCADQTVCAAAQRSDWS
jgi:hypothetical protein